MSNSLCKVSSRASRNKPVNWFSPNARPVCQFHWLRSMIPRVCGHVCACVCACMCACVCVHTHACTCPCLCVTNWVSFLRHMAIIASYWPGLLLVDHTDEWGALGIASSASQALELHVCYHALILFTCAFWGSNSWPLVSRQALYQQAMSPAL